MHGDTIGKTIMKFIVLVLSLSFLFMGCSPHITSLDREIEEHQDRWDRHWQWGASSNHWALLDRIVSVEDVHDRIRLVGAIKGKLWKSPKQQLADYGDDNVFDQRMSFVRSCASRLTGDKHFNPEALVAGWKLNASWLDDLENLMDLTEQVWNGGEEDVQAPQGTRNLWNLAFKVRREYELYFKYTFACCVDTYRHLPESARPAFVEQIKRDFFHRRGMKYVDMNDFPPAFRK